MTKHKEKINLGSHLKKGVTEQQKKDVLEGRISQEEIIDREGLNKEFDKAEISTQMQAVIVCLNQKKRFDEAGKLSRKFANVTSLTERQRLLKPYILQFDL